MPTRRDAEPVSRKRLWTGRILSLFLAFDIVIKLVQIAPVTESFERRVGDPLFSHVLFPPYVGLLVWGGLFLREARLRVLVPLRSDSIA